MGNTRVVGIAGTPEPGGQMDKPATRIRPFVGGKAVAPDARTFAYTPPRPFAFTGRERPLKSPTSTSSLVFATAQKSPTPLWTVAVYEPGMERDAYNDAPRRVLAEETSDIIDASLALADDVVEAQRHAASLAAADVLEGVARQLRRGEILLLPGASTQTDAAVISSVLAALLGGRR